MKMSEPVTEVITEARELLMTRTELWSLVVAFVFGGFTSAIWTWKEAVRKPKRSEIASTFIVSGLITMVVISLMLRWSPQAPMIYILAISILCGFSGDILVRPLVKFLGVFVNALTGKSVLPTTQLKEPDDKS